MTARRPLPEPLDGRPFSVAEARRLGVARHRLDRADLQALYRGSRSPVGETSRLARAAALATRLPEGAAFTGSTAAWLWGMPLPNRLTAAPFEVSSLRPRRALRLGGVIGTQRTRGDVVERHGLPVLSRQATFIALARHLPLHDLVAIADHLLSPTVHREALTTRVRLDAEIAAHRGSPNLRTLRRALDLSRTPVWSRPETLLRLLIAGAGLPEPLPNLKVLAGRQDAYLDLAWPDIKLGIEYDGRWHLESVEQRVRDAERAESLADAGWLLVRFRGTELFGRPHDVIARLVRRRADRGAPSSRTIDLTNLPRFEP